MAKKSTAASTAATLALDNAGISYRVHHYTHSDAAPSYGLEAAEQLAVDPRRVFKTLMVATGASASDRLAIAIVPVAAKLDLKAVAAVLGSKKAVMADKTAAQRRSGYVLGGISPFGQRQVSPAVLDLSAQDFESIFISGGRRAMSLELSGDDVLKVLHALCAPIAIYR